MMKTMTSNNQPMEKFMEAKLPPDPDGQNNDRALWADHALRAFMAETGTDYEDALCDLLCDLMHLSDRAPFDFDAALQHARDHYLAETGQPGTLTD
jgi:hypothetical protein